MVERLAVAQRATLIELAQLWPNQEFTLIGALALHLALAGYERQTNDIDITLILPPQLVRDRLQSLNGWAPSPGIDHEWRSRSGSKVHVIPITEDALQSGEMTWPESGRRMSVKGMHLAFEHRETVIVEGALSVAVATVPCIVALKAVSYGDRPYARERDLGDIAEALEKYIADDDDRRWTPETEMLLHEDCSAFLLGKDVCAITDDDERGSVTSLVEMVELETDGGRAQATMLKLAPPSLRYRPADLLQRLSAFKRGLGAP